VQRPDGFVAALVPMREGENEVEVRARGADGREANALITVRFAAGVAEALSPSMAELRAEMLAALPANPGPARRSAPDVAAPPRP
jgi:hypothetical protein